ncbi:MAG: hypothetical protein AAF802_05915 [Planctomycetota bacterium]
MPFDQSVLLWCVVAPAAIAAGAFVLGSLLDRILARSDRAKLGVLIFALGWWAAIATSLSARLEWQLWPSEWWRDGLWPLLGWSFLCLGCLDEEDRSWRWMIVVLVAGLTAWICLPSGDDWTDLYHLHGPIGIVATLSLFANTWSLDQMSRGGAERWVLLVALASLGGPLTLAASCFASLTEWSVSMASATAIFAIATIVYKQTTAWGLAGMIAAAGTCITIAGRFQTYETHPVWLYALMFSLPSICASVDYFLRGRSGWMRVAVSAGLSAFVVGGLVWFLLIRETEPW